MIVAHHSISHLTQQKEKHPDLTSLQGIGLQEKAPLNHKYMILLVFRMIQLPLYESNHLSPKSGGQNYHREVF